MNFRRDSREGGLKPKSLTLGGVHNILMYSKTTPPMVKKSGN